MEEQPEASIQVPLIQREEPPEQQSTYLKTNFIDTYFLFWVGKLIAIGKKKPFQQDMHWNLRQEETSDCITSRLSEQFKKNKTKKDPLFKALVWTCKGIFARAMFCLLCSGLLEYTGPLLIKYIIKYISSGDTSTKTGVLLVLGVVFSRILIAIFSSRAQILLTLLGINTSKAVNGLIYEKSLNFSIIQSAEHSQGSLVNHIQVDSEKLYYLGLAIGGAMTLPLLIGVGIYFMWMAVGIAFLSGIGVLLIMTGVNFIVGKTYFTAQKAVMKKKDERMKLSTEILNGIKYIKLSGWEEAFLEKLTKARDSELSFLKKQFISICFSIFFLWLTPMLITTAIFATYIFTGNPMTAQAAFTLVSTLMILQQPMRALPYTITLFLESRVAMNRVSKFLTAEEVKLEYIKSSEERSSDVAIKMRNGSFYWMSEEEKKLKQEKEKEDKMTEEEKKKKKKQEAKEKKEKKKLEKEEKKKKVAQSASTLTQKSSLVVTSYNPQSLERQRLPPQEKLEEPLLPNGEGNEAVAVASQDSVSTTESSGYRLVLEDVNLEIKKGSFVAILGDVGSGKSSLLFSLVGEMKYHADNPPEVEINGQISYVTQQPWILNTTVKDNIIFGNKFEEQRYQDVIKYSSLGADLDILIHKDETEIGEKGVNLSGGQKARVSLARALYKDSDIYLLDDPLSAVDAHVGNFILKECFLKYLKEKTRVLVTHKFESLKHADYIYIFSKGKIAEEGTLESLKESPIFQEVEKKYKMQDKNGDEIIDKEGPIESAVNEKDPTSEPEKSQDTTQITLVTEEKAPTVITGKEKEELQKVAEEDDKELREKLMLDEDREIGDISWDTWKAYFTYYGGWFYFSLVFFVMFTWISLQTLSNFWLSYWSDTSAHPEHSNTFYFGVYAGLGLSYGFFSFVRTWMLTMQSIKSSRTMHRNMFSKIIRAPVNLFFDRVPTGRLLNRLSKDLTVLDSYISTAFGYFLVTVYSLLADIIVCLIVGTFWVFPLVMLFFFFSFKIQRSYMRVNREVTRLEGISKSPIVSYFSESLAGLTSIRAYHEQDKFREKFHTLQSSNIQNLILSAGLYNWFNLRVTFCTILVIAPTVAIPLLFQDTSKLSAGVIGLLITYVIQINDDIISFLWSLSNIETKLVSFERCKKFTYIEGEANPKTQNPDAVQNYTSNWPARGGIDFKNYSVKYRPNLPNVIDNINLHVNYGEKIGVVGRTGSGKSTLFLALLRILEPLEGSIFIDDVNISEIGLDDLRRKITIIPQDPMLFKGTLKENLDLLGQYTDEELWQSLERVCMKEKFEGESGLATEIKEAGENLSAGEKQLLCIGRAILAQSKIILIDEATSNIDPKTEQTILDTINNSFQDCTVITVAHRLKTIINADRVLVMGTGKVLEFDKPQTLIDDETTYFHKLWMEYEHGSRSHL